MLANMDIDLKKSILPIASPHRFYIFFEIFYSLLSGAELLNAYLIICKDLYKSGQLERTSEYTKPYFYSQ